MASKPVAVASDPWGEADWDFDNFDKEEEPKEEVINFEDEFERDEKKSTFKFDDDPFTKKDDTLPKETFEPPHFGKKPFDPLGFGNKPNGPPSFGGGSSLPDPKPTSSPDFPA
mmetsp:Transcript_6156/g.9908  ORF Transcript_6156/g.9908 Transcript_6156/m.9908 type:complete len:113 (+) Transcript_6156:1620-1958(+)